VADDPGESRVGGSYTLQIQWEPEHQEGWTGSKGKREWEKRK